MNVLTESFSASGTPARSITDRHVFVFMAVLFLVLTLAGFVPSSLDKLAAVQAGERPPFPWVLHVHAVLMGGWLLLLVAQATLMAGAHRIAHRTLGMLGIVLLAAMVVSGVVLVQVTWQGLWAPDVAASMPPAALTEVRTFLSNILLLQVRVLVIFPTLVVWGLLLRRRDPEAHWRLMLLGTSVPVLAGIDRLAMELGWTTLPSSPLALDVYLVAMMLPLMAWDWLRGRHLHHTTRVWLGLNLAAAVVTNLLWNAPWWLGMAPRLIGVG